VVDHTLLGVDVTADHGEITSEAFAELAGVHLLGELGGATHIDIEE
jgi:hypothetical protein